VKDDRRPVLIGAAQLVQRDVDLAQALSPLQMLERTAREAADDAGAGGRLLSELDSVGIVDVVAWHPKNGPALLAERLGARPRRQVLSAVGGEIPLRMVNQVARSIAAGEIRLALVGGANNVRTLRRAQKARVKLNWEMGGAGEPDRLGVTLRGHSEAEARYGLDMPISVYPIFENALRAQRGLDLETHRKRVGALMSRFTDVAAKNPYAWFPVARSADEITLPTPENRMTAFPYTKFMNAVLETDQAAAVILASAEAARSLGIPEDRWVYWWGGAHAQEECWYPSERPDFARCEALERAATAALCEAGLQLSDLAHLDFYSCFPVAVEMACQMLGLDENDARGFTVTGGLPYAGGPGNNYALHSLAASMERVRAQPGDRALVTGNGWYLTKHSATVIASAPPGPGTAAEPAAAAAAPEIAETTRSTDPIEGAGRVETYTVIFERDGTPVRGIILGRGAEGRRFVANTPEDRQLLESLVARDPIGSQGTLRQEEGRNVFDPA
jgi:acetyl-CoA C-acetyltransferase